MPFKSKAQRRKFAQLLVEGKISDQTYEEWNRSTGRKVLPERLHPPKSGAKKKAGGTSKKKRAARVRARTVSAVGGGGRFGIVLAALLLIACGGSAADPARPLADVLSDSGSPVPTAAATQPAATTPAPTIATRTPTTTSLPTAIPAAAQVVFTIVRSPVSRGSVGQIGVRTTPNTRCAITVTYASGPSAAAGLGPMTSDSSGVVGWAWNIGTNTTRGTYPIDVVCGSVGARAMFTVE